MYQGIRNYDDFTSLYWYHVCVLGFVCDLAEDVEEFCDEVLYCAQNVQ